MHTYAIPTPSDVGAGLGAGPWLMPAMSAYAIPAEDGWRVCGRHAWPARGRRSRRPPPTLPLPQPARLQLASTGCSSPPRAAHASSGDWSNEIHLLAAAAASSAGPGAETHRTATSDFSAHGAKTPPASHEQCQRAGAADPASPVRRRSPLEGAARSAYGGGPAQCRSLRAIASRRSTSSWWSRSCAVPAPDQPHRAGHDHAEHRDRAEGRQVACASCRCRTRRGPGCRPAR